MKEKREHRPIDILRDSAGSMEVGSEDDPSAATGAIEIDGLLHIVKEGGIYEVKLADQIDPGRTDPDVPNVQQRILSYGSGSELVRQTLVAADALLRNGMVAEHVDKNEVLSASLAAAKDLAAMADLFAQVAAEVSEAKSAEVKNRSASLPALRDLEPRVNTFIQKADHSLQSLLRIVRAFFGKDAGRNFFECLRDLVAHRFGATDGFTQYLNDVLPGLQVIRAARNCVEHPHKHQKLILKNFSLQSSPLAIVAPTIEVVHPKHSCPEVPLVEFLRGLQHIGILFEEVLAGCVSKNLRKFGELTFGVVEVPPERRGKSGARFKVTIIGGGAVAWGRRPPRSRRP